MSDHKTASYIVSDMNGMPIYAVEKVYIDRSFKEEDGIRHYDGLAKVRADMSKLGTLPFHNGLTYAESERLAMLAEECSEVIQIVGKILRHGYDSYHPDNPSHLNRAQLEEEIMDVHAVVQMMKARGDISTPDVGAYMAGRIGRKLRYSHHQRNDAGA